MTSGEKVDGVRLTERIASLVANLSDEKKQMLLDTLIAWQQKEQRNDSRISCLLAIDYATQTRAYRDFMQDLSKGGVFIETREPLYIGESLSMTFTIPKTGNHFKIAGTIVRSDERGVGVEFDTKLTEYQEQIIKGGV